MRRRLLLAVAAVLLLGSGSIDQEWRACLASCRAEKERALASCSADDEDCRNTAWSDSGACKGRCDAASLEKAGRVGVGCSLILNRKAE